MSGQTEKYQWLAVLVLVILAGVGATFWYLRIPSSQPLVIASPTSQATVDVSSEVSRTVKVYVTGAVLRPGVYPVEYGARVEDAVHAAGGLSIEADRERINLAQPVTDGQHVQVPVFRETLSQAVEPGTPPSSSAPAKVNINTASAADLERLPRIGTAIASRIISYRDTNGPFTSIDQLKELKILNEGDFEQVKGLISVN